MTAVKVATVGDIRELRPLCVRVGDLDIALFRVRGEIFAVDTVCAHQHFSILHEGEVNEYTVSCPMHGWTYDLRTGRATAGQGRIATYTVRIEGEMVFVEIADSP